MRSCDARIRRMEDEMNAADGTPLIAWVEEDGSLSGPGAGAAKGRKVMTLGWDYGNVGDGVD
ncbi:MAG: hypothetical protein LBL73_05185 [Synergistaceae bacterium]|nr:hypothetical protein [Synergistaceae bacterium]